MLPAAAFWRSGRTEEAHHPSAFHIAHRPQTPHIPSNDTGSPTGSLVAVHFLLLEEPAAGACDRQERGLQMGLEQKRVCSCKLREKKQIEDSFPFCGCSGAVAAQNTEALGHIRWETPLPLPPRGYFSVLFDLPKLTTGNNRIQEAS